MNIEQQHAILDKTYKQLTEFCGKPPRGSVAPWWEASQEGAELMLKYGVEYGQPWLQSSIYSTSTNPPLKKTTASPITIASPTGFAQATPGPKSITVKTPLTG